MTVIDAASVCMPSHLEDLVQWQAWTPTVPVDDAAQAPMLLPAHLTSHVQCILAITLLLLLPPPPPATLRYAGVRVESVRRDAHGVTVTDASGHSARFDELVFACGAEEAKRMLGKAASRCVGKQVCPEHTRTHQQ